MGGPSAWCEGNHFKVGGPGPGNENFLAELSQSLVFFHICLSEVDKPVPTHFIRLHFVNMRPGQTMQRAQNT